MTCDTSAKAPTLIAARGTFLISTWSARMRVDSAMSALATTTGPSVGTAVAPFGVAGDWSTTRMPTKATMARKNPTSRTSRFERFKFVLPEGGDV